MSSGPQCTFKVFQTVAQREMIYLVCTYIIIQKAPQRVVYSSVRRNVKEACGNYKPVLEMTLQVLLGRTRSAQGRS